RRLPPPAISTLSLHDALPISAFLPGQLQVVGPPPQTDTGPQFVFRAAEQAQDTAGVGRVGGLADDLAVEPADGVRRQHDSRSDRDRKSTRLNSSHVAISYAVF